MPDAGRAISLAALTVLEVSPCDAVRIAARCGYSHVGLRLVAATEAETHWPVLSDVRLATELGSTLLLEGISVLDVEIVRLVPEIDWAAIEEVLDLAEWFGASRLLVADNDPDQLRSHDSLARLAEAGAKHGITPHLEFMPWTRTSDLAAARARIAGIANARLLVDAFHLARSGGSPDDLVPCDPDVGYLQLCDIAGPIPAMDEILREARSERLMPGTGDIDLCALLERFPGLPLSLEVPNDAMRDAGVIAEDRARRVMEHMRAVLEKCGG